MKKILTLALAGLAMASCTADYECRCTVTDTWGGNTSTDIYTVQKLGVTQGQVESDYDCVSYEQTYTDSQGDVSLYSQDCTITKK